GIHAAPLAIFTAGSSLEVLGGVADAHQLLIEQLAVHGFVGGEAVEKGSDFRVIFLLGALGKKGVLVTGHGLALEGGQQIFFGLCSLNAHCHCLLAIISIVIDII